MKKLLFLSLFLISSASAFAQHEVGTLSIQPKVGLNIADFRHSGGSSPRYGLAGGVEVEYQLTQKFSMSAGVLYSMQGAKSDQTYYTIKTEERVNVDYINLPIMANVYVIEGLALKFGVQPAFNVDSRYKIKGPGFGLSGSLTNVGIDVKTFDFSIPIGLSFEYNNFVIDGRYNYGVTRIISGDDSRNSVLQFTVGYKFCL